jgi:uncharacterized protein YjiS (DUF1127 family)
VIGLTAKAVGRCATFGEVAFSGILLAALSWTFSQALAGCAAYAEAMYPNFVDLGEHGDRHDPVDGTQSRRGIPDRLQNHSSAAAPVEAEYIERPQETRTSSPAWSASIASLVVKFRSRIRHERDRRLAIMELRALDDRTLRDIRISRCDIEYFARHGDRCG